MPKRFSEMERFSETSRVDLTKWENSEFIEVEDGIIKISEPIYSKKRYTFFDELKVTGTMRPHDLETYFYSTLIGLIAYYQYKYDYPSIFNSIELQWHNDKLQLVQFDSEERIVYCKEICECAKHDWIQFEFCKIPCLEYIDKRQSKPCYHRFKVTVTVNGNTCEQELELPVNDLSTKFQLGIFNCEVACIEISRSMNRRVTNISVH